MTENNILDVAVVGGGISGVYSAWRLLADGRKESVTVYEADKHIGGRLLSVKPPGIKNMVAELGGMRILDEKTHPLINALIDKLNDIAAKDPQSGIIQIDLYDFPVNDPPASDNIVLTRGTSFHWSDIKNQPDKVPYKLRETTEKGKSLGQIVLDAIKIILNDPEIDKRPPEEVRTKAQKATYGSQNLPLYEQGFWDILTQVISYEAYKLEQDVGGYSTTLSNWNAADAIPWFLADFGNKAKYRGFAQGYRQMVVNMAKLFTNAGGNIVCNQKLVSFNWDSDRKVFTLTFADRDPVVAKALILAMPRRSLELISCGNKYLSDDATSNLIKSVTPQPAFKIFSTYPQPWWKDLKLTLGRSVTDLPIRQTYYWANSQGKPIEDGPAMLMASYDDGNNPDFWNGYRDWEGAKFKLMGSKTNSLKWTDNAPTWSEYQPKQEQIKVEMTRQLAELHGVPKDRIQPTSICYKNWAEDPFGGAWNFWNIGVKSPDVMHNIIKPHSSLDLPLYICGDAYSNWPGWVEGALETANMVLALPEFNVKPT